MSKVPLTPHGTVIPPLADPPVSVKRERLRFTDFRFTRTPAGTCRAEVELEWFDGMRVTGSASGHSSPFGDLRIAAEAALQALESFVERQIQFEILGIRSLRAFDSNVVIAAVLARQGDDTRRLIGCYLSEDGTPRDAVLAVLNATNRTLGNFIAAQ
jgi:hypothetical protein